MQLQAAREFNAKEYEPFQPTPYPQEYVAINHIILVVFSAMQVWLDPHVWGSCQKNESDFKRIQTLVRKGKVFNTKMEKNISSSPVLLLPQSGDHHLVITKGNCVD